MESDTGERPRNRPRSRASNLQLPEESRHAQAASHLCRDLDVADRLQQSGYPPGCSDCSRNPALRPKPVLFPDIAQRG